MNRTDEEDEERNCWKMGKDDCDWRCCCSVVEEGDCYLDCWCSWHEDCCSEAVDGNEAHRIVVVAEVVHEGCEDDEAWRDDSGDDEGSSDDDHHLVNDDGWTVDVVVFDEDEAGRVLDVVDRCLVVAAIAEEMIACRD